MNKLLPYYLTRLVVAGVVGTIFVRTGSPWWISLLVTAGVFALFVWALRSGHYVVQPEGGVTPLQRDEYDQQITNQAARNAWVVLSMGLAALSIYASLVGVNVVPTTLNELLLMAALLTYFITNVRLRR